MGDGQCPVVIRSWVHVTGWAERCTVDFVAQHADGHMYVHNMNGKWDRWGEDLQFALDCVASGEWKELPPARVFKASAPPGGFGHTDARFYVLNGGKRWWLFEEGEWGPSEADPETLMQHMENSPRWQEIPASDFPFPDSAPQQPQVEPEAPKTILQLLRENT